MSKLCIGRFICFRLASALRSSSLINTFQRIYKYHYNTLYSHSLLFRNLLSLNQSSRHVFPPRIYQSAPANSNPAKPEERTQTPCTSSSSSNRAEVANTLLYIRQGRPRADSNRPASRHHSSRPLRPSGPIQFNAPRSQKQKTSTGRT